MNEESREESWRIVLQLVRFTHEESIQKRVVLGALIDRLGGKSRVDASEPRLQGGSDCRCYRLDVILLPFALPWLTGRCPSSTK